MQRLQRDIASSRRMGRIALLAAAALGLLIGFTLLQGMSLAVSSGRNELLLGAGVGLFLLVAVGAFVARLGVRQKRLLDAAERDLAALEEDWKQVFLGEEPDG